MNRFLKMTLFIFSFQSQLRLSSISSAISLDNLDSNISGRSYAEDNDDFVLTALLCAAEDGDIANIKKLCNLATIDVNKENKVEIFLIK
jgi:hypothetical protein